MNNTQLSYFKESDVLHISISNDSEADSVEINPNITAELNDKGELIGIEILKASSYMRDFILETVQAKLLDLSKKIA